MMDKKKSGYISKEEIKSVVKNCQAKQFERLGKRGPITVQSGLYRRAQKGK